jgi:hypothetical protein
MSTEERIRRSTLSELLRKALNGLFWASLVAEVAWLALSVWATGALSSVLDAKGQGLAHLLILCALALSSGLLLMSERRANPYNEPNRQWSLAETLYALALFYSLFFGAYAFFGWYYSS